MIKIYIAKIVVINDKLSFEKESSHTFHNKVMALRFMYKMNSLGYKVISIMCDDLWDYEWIERRFNV